MTFKLIAILALAYLSICQNGQLIYVQSVFRHGARYPIHLSLNDNTKYVTSQHSFGELTKQGKSQHYILGQQMYLRYWNKLFGGTPYEKVYNQSKFYVKSTNVNRTIESVQSQLMGLLEKLNPLTINDQDVNFSLPLWPDIDTREIGPVYTNAPAYHPIPIHVQKGYISSIDKGDFLRYYSSEFCYTQAKWTEINIKDPKIIQMTKHPKFVEVLAALSKEFKTNIQFFTFYKYYDNYNCMKYERREYPSIFDDPKYKDTLEVMYSISLYMQFFYTSEQLAAISTGYFNQTVNHFKRVIADQSGVQMALYSAHDTTVANFMAALNLTNVDCIYQALLSGNVSDTDTCLVRYPYYTASLIFQIYKYPSKAPTFKIKYNGQDRKIPFCNWQLECPVDVFYSWYNSWKNEDFVAACGVKDATEDSVYLSISILQFGVLLVFFIGYSVKYMGKKKDGIIETKKQVITKNQIKQSLVSEQD